MNENKTLAEVYEEVSKDQDLQKAFYEAQKNGATEDFAAKLGCKATADEIETFLKEKLGEDKSLSLDDLNQVAGGGGKGIAWPKCPNCGSSNVGWRKTGETRTREHRIDIGVSYITDYQAECHCNECGNDFEAWV